MKKQLFVLLLLGLTLLLSASVSAYATSVNLVTANATEFNTGLPTVTVNITGNCSSYSANLTINGVVVKTGQAVANATNTEITATTSTSAGSHTYNVTFYNATCFAGTNTTSSKVMEINNRPTISAVTGYQGAWLKGKAVTWTTTWADTNSSGVDSVTVYACKTNAFTSAGCTGGEWGHSSAETDNSTSATYTILGSDNGGTKNAYVFVIDDNNYTVSSSTQANFVISRPLAEEEFLTVAKSDGIIPTSKGFWIVVVIVAILLIVVIKKK